MHENYGLHSAGNSTLLEFLRVSVTRLAVQRQLFDRLIVYFYLLTKQISNTTETNPTSFIWNVILTSTTRKCYKFDGTSCN